MNKGISSFFIGLIMFFVLEVLNVYWQTEMLSINGEIDTAVKVSDKYNLTPIPWLFIIIGVVMLGTCLYNRFIKNEAD